MLPLTGPIDALDRFAVTTIVSEYAAYESPLLAQHGLSLLCDAWRGGRRFRILMDAGQKHSPVLANLKLMGLHPSSIDLVFLSHSHFDHTHGLEEVLVAIDHRVPVVAHDLIFRTTIETAKPASWRLGLYEAVDRPRLEAAGADFLLVRDPFRISPGVMSSGAIEETADFERPPDGVTVMVKDGRLVSDLGIDDLALVANVAGQGLVIVTGCGHAGLVNTIRTARKVSGVERVAGVVGGFHLLKATSQRVNLTVEELAAAGARVIAGHCTGFRACAAMEKILGKDFGLLLTGETHEFGAGPASQAGPTP